MKPCNLEKRRYHFDNIAFRCAVTDAMSNLGTNQSAVARELGIGFSTMSEMVRGRSEGYASPLVCLCAHLGLNPTDYIVDTDARQEQPRIPKTYREAVVRIRALEKALFTKDTDHG